MRIAHISDLHISENDSEQSLERVYKLLKVLSFKGFDHIIITGDVTENGTLAEFELVKEMLDLFDLLDPQKATVIIGNHDIYGGLQRLEDLIHYPACFTKSDFNHKVAEFHDTFRPLLANAKQNHGRIYPFLKKVNTTNILGLNSVRQFSRLMNPFGAKGLISAEQILHAQELLQDINDDDLLIIAVHHHFNPQAIKGKTLLQYLWRMIEIHTMKLPRKSKLLNMVNGYNLGAVLHGHTHHNEIYNIGGIRFCNAGSSIMNQNGICQYNVLTVANNKAEISQKIHYANTSGSLISFWSPKTVGLAAQSTGT